jgi:SAM-dependent methyltransferase
MSKTDKLRELAKKIGPLYWLAGCVRYLRFTRNLRAANLSYAHQTNPTTPPPMLRYRVHGALDETSYLEVGRYVASCLVQCLEGQHIAGNDAAILDFACGPGRVAVELKRLIPSCHLYGADIDREAIAWVQDNLSYLGEFSTNEPLPPTRYASEYFDVIYSISLFTHLDEPLQNLWLAELARILKPGGTLLTTVHGAFVRECCTPDELRELNLSGIVFRVARKGRFKLDGLPDFYQTTFHTPEYVARVWHGFFEVVDHVPGWLGQHQDLVILRRRP